MCGFIAQLVKHRTGIAEVTDPVEALIFFRLLLPIAQIGKFTAMTILKFQIIFLVFQLPRLFKLLHFLMDSLLKNDVFLSLDNAVKFIDKHSFD